MAPQLTDDIIRSLSTPQSFERGQELYQAEAIFATERQENVLLGKCEGSTAPDYSLRVEIDEGGVRATGCSCPYVMGGLCKHRVALLLTFVHQPQVFVERESVAQLTQGLEREALVALLEKLAAGEPGVYERLAAEVAAVRGASRAQDAAQPRRKTNVSEQAYRRQVKQILRGSGYRDDYGATSGVVDELSRVCDAADSFLEAGDADGALTILATLLEEMNGVFEEFDDSDGELGEFLDEVSRALAETILSLDLTDAERAELKKRLQPAVDDAANYGVDGVELVMLALDVGWGTESGDEEWDEDEEEYSGELTEIKLNVLDRQGRVDEYLRLCLEAGKPRRYALKLLELGRKDEAVRVSLSQISSVEDGLAIAQRLRDLGHVQEAIAVGERGLGLEGHKYQLGTWLGPLEEAQGRSEQALQAYLAAFNSLPSVELYQTLQRLAGTEWATWKDRAMETLKATGRSSVLAEVYLLEQEWDAAIQIADASSWDYRLAAKTAEAVLPHRPEWVIQASKRQAEALIEKGQSKYYATAAVWLEWTKKAYAQMGRQAEWQQYLSGLKTQYSRRPALQAELRRL